MQCEVCVCEFSSDARPPKVMPCGHTACLECLSRLQQCPTCRKEIPQPPAALPTNYSLLALAAAPRRTLWCLDCRAVASPRCDDHMLTSIKRALQQASKDTLPDIQDTKDILDEGQQLAALRLLTRPVRVTLDGGEGCSFTASCREDSLEDKIVRTLVLVLAGKAALQEHPATPAARREPAIVELDLLHLSLMAPTEELAAKEEMLQRVHQQGVRRLVGVWCNRYPAWSLQLLGAAGPLLEELQMSYPRREHLEALLAMPRLRRLEVSGGLELLGADPVRGDFPGGLQWLNMGLLHRDTVTALLRGNRATLRVLWLHVGTEGPGRWPDSCSDLHSLLGACGLQRLDRLVLLRGYSHTDCQAQLAAVRAVLPGTTVQCHQCDGVPYEAL